MGHPVVHFEVGAADDGPLLALYGELFGWELQGFPGGGYTMIDTRGGSGINGGIGRSQTGDPWASFYVETDDLQATLDRATALGGTTVLPVTDFGGAATIAMFNDPDGLLIGLVQAAADPDQEPPAPSAGSGAAVTWFEIMGSDAARTQRFYADLFGWTVDSSSFPAYATVDTGTSRGIKGGGIGGGLDTRWAIVYAMVPDKLDETFSRVTKLGGSPIADQEVPELKSAARAALYGAVDETMQTGAFRDPAGNVFGVTYRG